MLMFLKEAETEMLHLYAVKAVILSKMIRIKASVSTVVHSCGEFVCLIKFKNSIDLK